MDIKEILKKFGIEDAETVEQIAAEVPKHFVPTSVLNERIAKAKGEAEDVQKAFDAYKAEVEEAAAKAKGDGDASAKALEELQQKYDSLKGDFDKSQNAIKERDAKEALNKALTEAGANPAALSLLASAALSRIEYGEDGKPSNVADVAAAVKGENEGLFGVVKDTGTPPAKATGKNEPDDEFLKGFGSTEKK